MANSGYKQATIAYKVSKPGGHPLDVEGKLCSKSGRKQAILLLVGYTNPDTTKYEVQGYFSHQEIVTGNPTVSYDAVYCPIGFIRLSLNRIILEPTIPVQTVSLFSSANWRLVSSSDIADIDFTQGTAGVYQIKITRTENLGEDYFIFRNEVTLQEAALYIVNVNSRVWVLDTGFWNNTGFWYDNGIWNF
ncbi:MAG: hypothetical protein LIO79_07560 [Rikenellaceae bacterium]|nr:hypothetical protein [Rikenellaceae bacterium]